MNKSESITKLAEALASFHNELKQPAKDKANPFFKSKYVPLENVVEAITAIAPKFGLSFIQYPINQDNKVGIVTVLMHSSGEFIETAPVFAQPAKNDAQAVGSVITYLKRYSLSAVFGITSDEDDDGNRATYGNSNPNQPKPSYNSAPSTKPNYSQTLKEKIKAVSIKNGVEAEQVYKSAAAHLKINKATKDLTEQEAIQVINYLSKLE